MRKTKKIRMLYSTVFSNYETELEVMLNEATLMSEKLVRLVSKNSMGHLFLNISLPVEYRTDEMGFFFLKGTVNLFG